MSLDKSSSRMPLSVWIAGTIAAFLRAIPFLITRLEAPPPGLVHLPFGFNPIDWLQYAAIINQAQPANPLLLTDPFTTDPQKGRFILLFHSALSVIHAATGIDIFGFWS